MLLGFVVVVVVMIIIFLSLWSCLYNISSHHLSLLLFYFSASVLESCTWAGICPSFFFLINFFVHSLSCFDTLSCISFLSLLLCLVLLSFPSESVVCFWKDQLFYLLMVHFFSLISPLVFIFFFY